MGGCTPSDHSKRKRWKRRIRDFGVADTFEGQAANGLLQHGRPQARRDQGEHGQSAGGFHLILAAMLVFTAGNVIAGLSDSLTPLLFARLLSGLAHGVFFAVASSVATRLVKPERAGAALALVFGGVTVAMSLGVPVGTWLGTILHWQVIFLVIAACGLIGSLGIAALMPAGSGEAATKGAGLRDLGVLFDRRLLAGASIPMLSYTGSFALYTFVSPILLHVTNVSVGTASLTLLAYVLGAAVGNVLCGRLTDSQGMDRASVILLVGIVLSLVLIAFVACRDDRAGSAAGLDNLRRYPATPVAYPDAGPTPPAAGHGRGVGHEHCGLQRRCRERLGDRRRGDRRLGSAVARTDRRGYRCGRGCGAPLADCFAVDEGDGKWCNAGSGAGRALIWPSIHRPPHSSPATMRAHP